ncbi:N-acetylglucosamine-6-phosphate deacetylase [Labedella phragmitis]|uniref:N-acetylglucosamine-6-phosphate deacetylase n=1 Tax=Labedella phragmitis TaxID=2498849 RepID=A0A3S4AJF4_9MICO|nr:N-acetylglucosamine-6-phosphate deacetylase [Labedella phragmitis]RWZ49891.1 N-acetylglucosamine-6-phosphate deacetylase [Labedella phragmitis]
MTDAIIIHSARLVDAGAEVPDAWVVLADGIVRDRGSGSAWRSIAVAGTAEIVSAEGGVLVPGFVDLHGHGGGGAAFDDGADAILTGIAAHRVHGTTRSVVSLVSARIDDLVERLTVIARLAQSDPTILGAHLEGPFLSPDNRGAHDPSALVAPTVADVERLVDAGAGLLVQVTIAPELPGAEDAIRAFRRAGVVVAVGHTAIDFAGASAAFTDGATLLTHAFNAMPGIHHRAPGPVVAAMAAADVVLELIADGIHVDPAVLALAFAGAPGRIALVTDAMAAAGVGDGAYELGGLAVTVDDGVARLTGSDVIAGSTLTQDAALRTVVTAGVPLPEAVRALTETPARVIGRRELGSLAVGSVADAVLLGADLDVAAVWVAGVRVHGAPAA